MAQHSPKWLRWLGSFVNRIRSFSTPFFGMQVAPAAELARSDTSFDRAQDERELLDEIWRQAVSEAYGAKDAARRFQEMLGQSKPQVIEAYFATNSVVKRWTCPGFAERWDFGGQAV